MTLRPRCRTRVRLPGWEAGLGTQEQTLRVDTEPCWLPGGQSRNQVPCPLSPRAEGRRRAGGTGPGPPGEQRIGRPGPAASKERGAWRCPRTPPGRLGVCVSRGSGRGGPWGSRKAGSTASVSPEGHTLGHPAAPPVSGFMGNGLRTAEGWGQEARGADGAPGTPQSHLPAGPEPGRRGLGGPFRGSAPARTRPGGCRAQGCRGDAGGECVGAAGGGRGRMPWAFM